MIRKKLCNSRKYRVKAMTLVELMLALAIISIVAAIAYPSYQSHLLKAHRTAALADLAKIQIELERDYSGSYQSAATSVLSGGVCSFCTLDSEHFTVSISATASAYTIKAEPIGLQLKDQCSNTHYSQLTINQTGEMTPPNCWQ
ncbi:prepilin-type N-terminal cleavage/methylation domain-containing protein [Vibrio tubiashii]|uniref:Prepilin-type N-terminal cleavage/methylation domain-containing protein n=1 Tax=Vibrio tubiashii TaxID=29498 RepID=A0AAE5EW38_9VIBR|nr:type IV pilin protein [Vibrio tubiashii]NOI81345.1 prepilin-type N-terminal cleavage/methylation domain-containing protein [Vibrio tubiashii]